MLVGVAYSVHITGHNMTIHVSSNDVGLIVVFVLVIIIPFIELILSGMWNQWYFSKGIPLLILRLPVGSHHSNIPPAAQLQTLFRDRWGSSLIFKQMDGNKYAFREEFSLFRLQWTPVMHGLLLFDFDNHQVVVRGFANWFPIFFLLLGIVAGIQSGDTTTNVVSLLALLLFFGLLYLIQLFRFTKAARFAAQAWSRQY
jgi:hypothetical protein